MGCLCNAAMRAKVHSFEQPGMFHLEPFESFCPAVGEVCSLPDFIQSARIAGVAREQDFARHSHPSRDPDIDSVRFCQGAAGNLGRRRVEEHDRHERNSII